MLHPQTPEAAAIEAGLHYVSDAMPGIRRRRSGRGFSYAAADGAAVRDAAVLRRIRALVIPPAWTDVWICPRASGHIQATGRDARGRKQYIYHPDFRALRESGKYDALPGFARLLPAIRARVAADMAQPGLPRDKVLATIVHLLETTLIRIGNADYAARNGSHGLTTLHRRHVKLERGTLRFRFTGKSGKSWDLQLQDRRVLKVVRACQDLPGQELFRYRDDDGAVLGVSSADVNRYLRMISGSDITAKDFRTWAGTVLAALALQTFAAPSSQREAKRNLKAALTEVSGKLGNTVAICRKCYIHPLVIARYLAGQHRLRMPRAVDKDGLRPELRPEEIAVLRHITRKPRAPVAVRPQTKTIRRLKCETVMTNGTQL
ncbi:MAG: DNA topoisomerase IB [Ferrovibrio sp.]|uniref:DNA topoisomerase IB n=1 Tax=Ferrovibrio sp. TaxID=1917215 RepID=UPI002634D358|nr:DNA topoisomerase IB [Ferrovibrio sp.]MCW0234406.1 DNA topoisomerase IB [Ferrovibrio sp.]